MIFALLILIENLDHLGITYRGDIVYEIPCGPAYRIQTQRLIIRCWDPKDVSLLKKAIDESLEHLRPWMPWAHAEPESLHQKVERLRLFRGKFDLGQDFYYGVFNPKETKVLGATGLHTHLGENVREIGYWLHKDYTKQGYATEASAALVKVAFEIEDVLRVEIHCDPCNLSSAAIPKRLGFKNEGVLRKRKPFREGELRDEMIWTLFADEYPNSPASQAQVEAFDVIGRKIPL
jgi:RimJ/RimL family protein N-acetyltransferase